MKAFEEDFIVVKFGEEKYMRDLYENGTVYCAPSLFYSTLEDLNIRGDKNEGVRNVIYEKDDMHYLSIQPSDKSGPPITLHPVRFEMKMPDNLYSNVYCLYSVPFSKIGEGGRINAPYQLREFGNWYVSFQDSREFQNRIASALTQKRLRFQFGLVEYFEDRFMRGNISGFEKGKSYMWQSESRFVIRNQVNEALVLNIGSVKDIASLFCVDNDLDV